MVIWRNSVCVFGNVSEWVSRHQPNTGWRTDWLDKDCLAGYDPLGGDKCTMCSLLRGEPLIVVDPFGCEAPRSKSYLEIKD